MEGVGVKGGGGGEVLQVRGAGDGEPGEGRAKKPKVRAKGRARRRGSFGVLEGQVREGSGQGRGGGFILGGEKDWTRGLSNRGRR